MGPVLIDLIQEGNTGLLYAIKEFNPYKGVCLITYAVWWIRGYIQEYLMRQYSLVRLGTNAKQRKLFYLLRREKEQMAQIPYLGGANKLLPVAGFKDKDVQQMRQRLKERDISLDQPVTTQNPTRLIDIQTNTKEASIEEELNFFQEKEILLKALKQLEPLLNTKEKFVLKNRLLSDQPFTLNKIGQHFSISKEAVRQIENRLIKKIKQHKSFKNQFGLNKEA